MKNPILRFIVIALILTGSIFLIVWYFTMRREIPPHARVIPKDAFAVLTLNLRELAIDRAGDDHLFPEMSDESLLQSELAPFTKAIAASGETGLNETADVLLFGYHSGETAFFGIAVQLEDSAAFGKLMRVHVTKEFNIVPWTTNGVPLMRFDTTAGVIGWTEDVALFLYPISHDGIATVATQCIELLKQKPESSVLTDENFTEQELKPFDVSLWVQTSSLMKFTGGGDAMEQLFGDVKYFNYMTDFDDGEILVRSEWHLVDGAVRDGMKEIPFPCEPSSVLGFVRFHLDPKNDTLAEHYVDAPPMNALPLSDEEAVELLPMLTGDCMSLIHDTVTYNITTIKYEYDENFNRQEIKETYASSTTAFSFCYQLADPVKARDFLTQVMLQDSIPLTPRGWVYKENGLEARMILTDDLLTVTTSPETDGRSHAIIPAHRDRMAWLDLASIFKVKGNGMLELLLPFLDIAYDVFAENLVELTSTVPVQTGNVRRSEIRLAFKNEEINGLVQAEEILRKVYYSKDH